MIQKDEMLRSLTINNWKNLSQYILINFRNPYNEECVTQNTETLAELIANDKAYSRILANLEAATYSLDLVNTATIATGSLSILVTIGREVVTEIFNPLAALALTSGMWLGFIFTFTKSYVGNRRYETNITFLKTLIKSIRD